MSWERVGEASGVAEFAWARGTRLAGATFEYAAGRSAFLSGQFGAFRWTCPDCGELITDRGSLRNHPAPKSRAAPRGCQYLAAQVGEWLSQGD